MRRSREAGRSKRAFYFTLFLSIHGIFNVFIRASPYPKYKSPYSFFLHNVNVLFSISAVTCAGSGADVVGARVFVMQMKKRFMQIRQQVQNPFFFRLLFLRVTKRAFQVDICLRIRLLLFFLLMHTLLSKCNGIALRTK